MNHINPDHYLDRHNERQISREEGKAGWEQAYKDLEKRLRTLGPAGTLFVVCGLQGAGKTTWVRANAEAHGAGAIFFDAALPSRNHRARALRLAAEVGARAVAVWLDTPFEVAVARNAARPANERVAEATIVHVYDQLEPPSLEEGFADVMRIQPDLE